MAIWSAAAVDVCIRANNIKATGTLLTLATPLEMSIVVSNAAVEVHLSIDILAVFTSDAAAQPVAFMDLNAGGLGGVVEVGHLECNCE